MVLEGAIPRGTKGSQQPEKTIKDQWFLDKWGPHPKKCLRNLDNTIKNKVGKKI